MRLWSSSFAELLLSLYMSRHRAACVCVCVLRNDNLFLHFPSIFHIHFFFFSVSVFLHLCFDFIFLFTSAFHLLISSAEDSSCVLLLPRYSFNLRTRKGRIKNQLCCMRMSYFICSANIVCKTFKKPTRLKKKNLWTSFFRTSFSMSCTSLSLNAPPPAPPRGVMRTGSKNSRTGETLQSEL